MLFRERQDREDVPGLATRGRTEGNFESRQDIVRRASLSLPVRADPVGQCNGTLVEGRVPDGTAEPAVSVELSLCRSRRRGRTRPAVPRGLRLGESRLRSPLCSRCALPNRCSQKAPVHDCQRARYGPPTRTACLLNKSVEWGGSRSVRGAQGSTIIESWEYVAVRFRDRNAGPVRSIHGTAEGVSVILNKTVDE